VIIGRYLTKEVLLSWTAVNSIVVLIAISNRFVTYLAKAAAGTLPITLVLKLVLLYIPELIGFLMPPSIFMALLLAYGRLHADSEMRVLFTSRYTWGSLIKLTLSLALVLSSLNGLLTFWLIPATVEYREKVIAEGEAIGMMQAIVPGRFQSLDNGRIVFYVESANNKTKNLQQVFIAEQPQIENKTKASWTVLTAAGAELIETKENLSFHLVMKQGHRYEGVPGRLDFTLLNFETYGRKILQAIGAVPEIMKLKTTSVIWHSNDINDKAEVQWRLAFPLSIPIISLLAIALSRVNPRQGRFAKFLPALMLYILYYNLLILSKRWMSNQALPPYIGLWWVHAVMLSLACCLLIREAGGLPHRYQLFKKLS